MKQEIQEALNKVTEALAIRQLNEYELDALKKLKTALEYALEVLRE